MRLTYCLLALFLLSSQPALADLLSALVAIEEKDYPAAIKELEPLAQRGDSQARYLLGKLLLEGRGGSEQVQRGVDLIQQAAGQDHGPSQAMLGFMYARGVGVGADAALAKEWLTRSLDRLGRGPVRANAEATLASLNQGELAAMAPPPASVPVPEVTEQSIAPMTQAPPSQDTMPAGIAARESPSPDISGLAGEPLAMPVDGSIIGPATVEHDATLDLAADAVESLVEAAPETAVVEATQSDATTTVVDAADVSSPETAVVEATQSDATTTAVDAADVSSPETAEGEAPTGMSAIAVPSIGEKSNRQDAEVPIELAARPGVQGRELALGRAESLTEESAATTAPPKPVMATPPAEEPVLPASVTDNRPEVMELPDAPSVAEEEIVTPSAPDILPRLAPLVDAQSESLETEPKVETAADDETTKTTDSSKPEQSVGANGIRIQLAAVPDEAMAESEWKRIVGRNAKLLANRTPIFKTIDLGEQGVFHRIQTGPFDSLEEARALCAKLIEAGQDCLVMGR